jgi:diguanylate cyclase (GGDEF)-like protein
VSAATILVADDSLLVRAVVRSGLEEEGYTVLEAVDGTAALERCRAERPDVVLLDIEMPGLNGYEVLARLKADPQLTNIPVVFLTSRTDTADIVAGLRGGAHDYLKKPFEPAELLARVGSAAHVKQLQDQLWERNAELDRISRTDSLTGLYNRWHLQDELTRQRRTAQRYDEPFSVILFDIDHFKHVNDTYGHPAGDLVLCEFARRLESQVRAEDVVGRWGGEEFLVLMPRTDLDGAMRVAERIRTVTDASPVAAGTVSIPVTVSGGCAAGSADDSDDLIKVADTRLYEAKAGGRNRIVAGEAR